MSGAGSLVVVPDAILFSSLQDQFAVCNLHFKNSTSSINWWAHGEDRIIALVLLVKAKYRIVRQICNYTCTLCYIYAVLYNSDVCQIYVQ